MSIRRIKMLSALLIPVMIYGILFFTFRKEIIVDNTVQYCDEIAQNINKIGLKNIVCTKIMEENGVVFEFDVKSGVQDYDGNDAAADVLKVKNYLIRYVSEHPENPLNEKNMVIFYPDNMLSYGAYSYTYMNIFEKN